MFIIDESLYIRALEKAIQNFREGNGNLKKIEFLLSKIKLVTKDKRYKTSLLHFAVDSKVPDEIFQLIVNAFKIRGLSLDTLSSGRYTAMDTAFLFGNVPAIKILFQEGADSDRIKPDSQISYFEYFKQNYPERYVELCDFIQTRKVPQHTFLGNRPKHEKVD